MSEPLRPCPACGGRPIRTVCMPGDQVFVQCMDCDFETCRFGGQYEGMAREAWNRRPAQDELLAICRSLLPYAENDRSPGPAMSDPWGPPTALIARARAAIARATGPDQPA